MPLPSAMDPEAYLDAMGRVATGAASAEETARALYDDPSPEDVYRLGVHERYRRWYRGSVLETHFDECRGALVASHGAHTWSRLVERYFEEHPPRSLPMPRNAGAFPRFLAGCVAQGELPAWLAEIADLEWLEWLVTSAPNEAGETDEHGPLRVTPTLETRVYRHDLIGWLDGDGPRALGGPPPVPSVAVVWRDRALVAQRASFGRLEHAVLAVLAAGRIDVEAALLSEDLAPAEVRAAVVDLRELGVLRGA